MGIDTVIINPHPLPSASHTGKQFESFSNFVRWVQQHWHDHDVLRHAQWVLSPFVAQGLRGHTTTEAWRTAPWCMPKHGADTALIVPSGLRWLDEAGARTLLDMVGEGVELRLPGITEIDACTAKVLAAFGGTLDLSGLRALTPEVASALASYQGLIRLDGLQSIGGSLVPLVRRRSPRGATQPGMSLGGLTKMTEESAHLLAQVQGELHLNGLTSLDEQQAHWLAQRKGDADKKLGTLHLNRWATLNAGALRALCAAGGSLSLGAWVPAANGAPDLWAAMAKTPFDSLTLGSVATLTEANARGLASLSLKRLYLPGIQTLDADLVEHLGGMVLLRLALDGVVQATAAQVRRLVQLQHRDAVISGLSMASLALTPEIRAELIRHKKLYAPTDEQLYAA